MKFKKRLQRLERTFGIVGGQLPCAVCASKAFKMFVTRFIRRPESGTAQVTDIHGRAIDGPADSCEGCTCRYAETVVIKGIDPKLL